MNYLPGHVAYLFAGKKQAQFVFRIITCFIFFVAAGSSVCRADIKFIPNKGQWDNDAKFRAEIPGGYLYVFNDRIYYQFYHLPVSGKAGDQPSAGHMHGASISSATYRNLEVDFLGASNVAITALNPSQEIFNYYRGQDETKWASNLHAYSALQLASVYPGISLQLYFKDNYLKYDWVVAPSADASLIKVQYKGADNIKIADSQLIIQIGVDTLIEDRPFTYITDDTGDKEIPCNFFISDSVLSYRFPTGYDHSKQLTIDPRLVFSSYTGSYANNWGNTATYDSLGNLYTGGIAFDVGFPLVPAIKGGFEQAYSGTFDVVIMEFSTDGKTRLFSTYLGGSYQETPHSMIVNKNNELIVMGSTSSSNFPVTKGAYDITFNKGTEFDPLGYGTHIFDPDHNVYYNDYTAWYEQGSDIFLVKFSGNHGQLLAGTYLGGKGNDGTLEVSNMLCRNYGDQFRGEVNIDAQGNILVAGNTASTDFPAINGNVKAFSGGTTDGILVKFTPDLSGIIWSTYLGGSGFDAAFGVCVDNQDNIFVSGGTTSTNFGIGYAGGGDGFIQKYASSGTLLATRLIGTSAYDQAYFVQADTSNNVYIYGQTRGQMLVSSGVYFNKNSGQFIQKFSNDLITQIFSTVIGSGSVEYSGINPDISPTAFLVSECGMIYICGWGGYYNHEDFGQYYIGGYTTGMAIGGVGGQAAYQSTTDGSDFYIMVLSQNASQLAYATFFGGQKKNDNEHVDGGTSRFDKNGNIYECVCEWFSKSDFPTTAGVVSNVNNSYYYDQYGIEYQCNNAAFKFQLSYLKAAFDTYSLSGQGPGFDEGCAPLPLNIVDNTIGGQTFNWTFGDQSTFSGFAPGKHTYDSTGAYQIILIVKDATACIQADTATETITVKDFKLNLNATNAICKDSTDLLTAIVTGNLGRTYQWSANNAPLSTDSSVTVRPLQETLYMLTVTDTVQHCIHTDSVDVKVYDMTPDVTAAIDNDCENSNQVIFKSDNPDPTASFNWSFGDGSSSTDKQPVHSYQPGKYTVSLQVENQLCHADTTLNVTIQTVFVPNLFTPNSDNLNESFEVTGTDSTWQLQVYDRWGGQVARYSNYTNQWNGSDVEDGVYYYLLTTPFNRKCKGWVQVLR